MRWKTKKAAAAGSAKEKIPDNPRQKSLERIRQLNAKSRHGLWGLTIFLLISVGAFHNFSFFPPIPDHIRDLLGSAPPTNLISIALVVYSFSALILILSRMMGGSESYKGWSHLAYLSAFYAFYYYGDGLRENFWAVFAAGLTIMILEYYNIWNYCNENIRQEKDLLAQIERRENFR